MAESLRVAHATGALKTDDMARVTVDTTVQPKDITFPTDAKLKRASQAKLAKGAMHLLERGTDPAETD